MTFPTHVVIDAVDWLEFISIPCC